MRRGLRPTVHAVAGFALMLGSAYSMAAEAPGVVLREFIYETAPFPECHASTIVETPTGLVTAWFGGTEEKDNDVGIWVSRHEGGKWSTPIEAANGVQHATLRYPTWNPVLHQPANSQLQLYYKCGPNPDAWWGMLTESTDGGKTWSFPRRLPQTIDGPVRNKAIVLKSGSLLCPSSTEYDGWRVHFEITPDLGKTWQRIGPINDGKEWNAIQPTVLVHKDGTLQSLCRTQEGKIVETRSKDSGQTWSPLAATSLPNPNSGIDGVTLADGRHLLVYNHTLRGAGKPRAREMLNVAVGDDGEHWKAAAVLENEKGEFSYPAVIQTKDGLVHTTYTHHRKKVRHVVIDPAKLELQEIKDGRWPGLPEAGVKP
jgi:predicted neuraminidase